MKKLLDSDWLRAVQFLCNSVQNFVIPCNHNYKNVKSDRQGKIARVNGALYALIKNSMRRLKQY